MTREEIAKISERTLARIAERGMAMRPQTDRERIELAKLFAKASEASGRYDRAQDE